MTIEEMHDKQVTEFLNKCQKTDPDKYKEVSEKYPVLTPARIKTIGAKEVSLSYVVEQNED